MKGFFCFSAFLTLLLCLPIQSEAQATIGSRDGISYIVTGKEYINEPNAGRCGYNDAGFPMTSRTTIEVREYEEYSKGKLIRRWTEKVKTDTICLE